MDLAGPIETLVRLVAAGCTVREARSASEVEDESVRPPDVVVYDVTGPSAGAVAEAMPEVAHVAIAPEGVPLDRQIDEERVLREPFGAPALTQALAGALGRPLPGSTVDPQTDQAVASSFAIGRLMAAAVAAVLELTLPPVGAGRALVLAAAFGYTGVRSRRTQLARIPVTLDVLVAVALVFTTGFVNSPYLLLAVVIAIEAGYRFGMTWAVLASTLIGTALLAGTLPSLESGEDAITPVLVSLALLPIASGAGALAARVRATAGDEGQRVLIEMNRTLERLAHQAQILPGGLEVGTVADQALVEVRETLEADAALVLVGEGELLRVIGAYGVADPVPTALRRDDPWWDAVVAGVRSPREAPGLPAQFSGLLHHKRIWLAPLRRGQADVGLLIAAGSGERIREAKRVTRILDELAVETSLALDNARLFELVRELSVDRERRRIARDLHDGVVQTLVHVGFELDLLGREAARSRNGADVGIANDARRLRKVIEGSVREVRATISDLRTGRAAEGLVSALREHLRDLRVVEGPRLVLESTGYEQLSPEVEQELFRMAQEAISNAVQHADASSVRVAVRATIDGHTMMMIEDDGRGLPNGYGSSGTHRGVGMRSLYERASLLGAELHVQSEPGAGTRVIVEVPGART